MRKTILLFSASLFLLSFTIASNAEDPFRQGNVPEGGTGRKWAFCIGVSNYRDPAIPALPSGARDAKGIAAALKEHGGFDRVLVLTDEAGEKDRLFPSRGRILELLNQAAGNMRAEDLVLFSFSGNGCTDANGKAFLLTPDSRLKSLDATAISMDEVMGFLKKAGVKRSILFIDASRQKKGAADDAAAWGIYPDRYMKKGVSAIFYAASKGYSSLEDISGYSTFARYLIQGIEGGADEKYGGNKDRVVTVKELASYVNMALSELYMTTSARQVPFVDILDKGQADTVISSADKVKVAAATEVPAPVLAKAPREKDAPEKSGALRKKETVEEKESRVPASPPPEKERKAAAPAPGAQAPKIDDLVKEAETQAAKPQVASSSQGQVQPPAENLGMRDDSAKDKGGPATLTLEQPSPGQAAKEKLVFTPVLVKKDALHLRSKPKDISIGEVKSVLTTYGFYSTCWNYNGDFCNPSGDFQNQFHDNGDGTVSDSSTGLMWQKGGSADGLTWDAARGYAEKMNRERFAGFSDWRIPTVEELASIMESSWKNGDLFIDPVFDRGQRQCWSQDTKGMEAAWKANFHQGLLIDFPMTSTNSVRLVRSLQSK